jgi:conjugal transfer/entry exclusion protein
LSSTNPAPAVRKHDPEHDGPGAYIWDQAQSTINGLMNAVDTLNYYKTQLGSLDATSASSRT